MAPWFTPTLYLLCRTALLIRSRARLQQRTEARPPKISCDFSGRRKYTSDAKKEGSAVDFVLLVTENAIILFMRKSKKPLRGISENHQDRAGGAPLLRL
jgi:hypothetical protein